MATAIGRRAPTLNDRVASPALVPADELRLWQSHHPNLLVSGPSDRVSAILAQLQAFFADPVVTWRPGDALGPMLGEGSGTVVLYDVESLSSAEQQMLVAWLRRPNRLAHVVATSSVPLFTLVEQGAFDGALYYTLNIVFLDAFPETARS
jgi:sigma-54-interacting transcriptional regulator